MPNILNQFFNSLWRWLVDIVTKNDPLAHFFDLWRCGFSPFHYVSSTRHSDILSTVYRRRPVFKPEKIRVRLRDYHPHEGSDSYGFESKTVKEVINTFEKKLEIPMSTFLNTFVNAEFAGSVDFTNSHSRKSQYSYYCNEVHKYRLTLPTVDVLQRDYVKEDFFRQMSNIEEALNFLRVNGCYYVEEMILGGRLSYSCSCHVEERMKNGAMTGFLGLVEESGSIKWNISTLEHRSMGITKMKICGGNATASTLEEWKESLGDVNKCRVIKVTLKPISDLIPDTDHMTETKSFLERAFGIKTSNQKYLEYCFDSSEKSIKCYSNTDPNVSVVATYSRTPLNSPDGVIVKIDEWPHQHDFQLTVLRNEQGKTICSIKRTGKRSFLCIQERRKYWFLKICRSIQERREYWFPKIFAWIPKFSWFFGKKKDGGPLELPKNFEKEEDRGPLVLRKEPKKRRGEWIFVAPVPHGITMSRTSPMRRVLSIDFFWALHLMLALVLVAFMMHGKTASTDDPTNIFEELTAAVQTTMIAFRNWIFEELPGHIKRGSPSLMTPRYANQSASHSEPILECLLCLKL